MPLSLLIKIENEWVPKRNFTIHSFVVVSEHNKHLSKDIQLTLAYEDTNAYMVMMCYDISVMSLKR